MAVFDVFLNWQFPAAVMAAATASGVVAMAVGGHRGTGSGLGVFLMIAGLTLGVGLPTVTAWADGSRFFAASSAFGFLGGSGLGLLVGGAIVVAMTLRWARAAS
ncbi:hypothetical protein ACFCYC_18910 [Streptomyces sp. NPDC056402]|uniref:hypothetical protein n=1 Tax=Streptomyces sp. NPDC056402 TaxID=3345810 RepID=UPI0035E17E9D